MTIARGGGRTVEPAERPENLVRLGGTPGLQGEQELPGAKYNSQSWPRELQTELLTSPSVCRVMIAP